MDIEWAKDGHTGELFIVQARPETVQSQKSQNELRSYILDVPEGVEPVARGRAVGDLIGQGEACVNLRGVPNCRVPSWGSAGHGPY
jgi:pyruvate,water dikinase